MILKLIKDFYWEERKKMLKADYVTGTIRVSKLLGEEWLKSGCFIEVNEQWTDDQVQAAVELYRDKIKNEYTEVDVESPQEIKKKTAKTAKKKKGIKTI